MKKSTVNILLGVALVVIFAISFVIGGQHTDPEERFAGTDSVVTTVLEDSGYQPWFSPFFQPESGEIESGLFALQAGIGGTVLGFAFGALWGRRHPTSEADQAESRPAPEPSSVDEVPADQAS
jgi:cobalt/nickel transport protein